MGIKGRGRSGRSRDSNPACLCCSLAHLVQCEPDEASSFTNPNVGPGTYASLRLKLDAWSSAVQRGQKCSSPTRRLPSRSCSWFRAPIRHECQTAQLKSRGRALLAFGDRSKCANYNWYHGQPHVPRLFLLFFQCPSMCLSFCFLSSSLRDLRERQSSLDGKINN